MESAPFQKTRGRPQTATAKTQKPKYYLRAEARIAMTPIQPTVSRRLRRRHFLRGLGACIALPAFESLLPARALATLAAAAAADRLATTATGAPLRSLFFIFPTAPFPPLGGRKAKEKSISVEWHLAAAGNSARHLQVVGGLEHLNATAGRTAAAITPAPAAPF